MNAIKPLNKNLYALLATQAMSLIGTRMTSFALGIWLFQRTGRAMDLLLMPFFNELPTLLFGHLLGVLVDRYDRKRLIVLTDLGQALGSLALFASIATGHFQLWHLYAVVTLQGLFAAIQGPAVDATMTTLTNKDNRSRANAVKELAFPAAGSIAPALAGLLYVGSGIVGVIMADLISFVLSCAVILSLRLPSQTLPEAGEQAGSWLADAKTGIRYLTARRGLLLLVIYLTVVNFILNGPLELVLPYLLQTTHSEMTTATLMALMSAATGISAFIFAWVRLPKRRLLLLILVMATAGTAMLFFGMSKSPILLAVLISLAMAPLPVLNIVFKTLLQDKVPHQLQGRVFSLCYQMAYGVAPLSFLVIGPLVDHYVEPLMRHNDLPLLSGLFGNQPGSGMGLTISAAGLAILLITGAFSRSRSFMGIESQLVDHNL